MDFIDYYKSLEIKKSASEDEIKKAYRKLARKYHPDLNPDDKSAEKKFKEINEANEVLSHPENRKKYDKYGKDWKHAEAYEEQAKQQKQWQQHAGESQFHSSGGFHEEDFSDFFNSMFGHSGRAGQSRSSSRGVKYKGQDFNADLHLDLKDVYKTHKQTLTVNGKKIRITIPAGVENGQSIKIKGYGGEGVQGGPKGDLTIKFAIANHSEFRRDKNNLYATINLDLYTAVLGGEVVINSFDGKVKLKVKAGTENGSQVKLKGKGFPIYKKEGQFGDLYIKYDIKIPTELNEKEKELFTELSNLR